jgi:transcription initiation factor IIE alpha subunit
MKVSADQPRKVLGITTVNYVETAHSLAVIDKPLVETCVEQLKDNSVERILSLMNQAGFVSCEKVREGTMLFGILRFAYYQGRRAPGSDPG